MTDTLDAYRVEKPGARFTEWLTARYSDRWRAATRHSFTQRLADDTLEDAIFRRYLIQDFAFVKALASLVGFAVGRAPDYAAKQRLAGFLAVLTGEETGYFERAMKALEISEKLRAAPPTTQATVDLCELMEDVSERSYADILSVLVPVEWIYLSWATEAARSRRPSRFYHAEWIDLHVSEDFRSFVDWLRRELDTYGAAETITRQEQLAKQFGRTVELEISFFDAAFDDDAPTGA